MGRNRQIWMTLTGATALLLCVAGQSRAQKTPEYVVAPYYVMAKDMTYHPEYEAAIRKLIPEVQKWYQEKSGMTFKTLPLKVVRSEQDYLAMRCGENPSKECRENSGELPNWLPAIEKAIGGFKPKTVSWVFAQGGGGWAGANLIGDYTGFALFGDWVLEPISNLRDPQLLTCETATWQCKDGVPRGTTVHEIGHAFGLHHPDDYPGKTIMKWHGDYPNTDLLPHEVEVLKASPYFVKKAYDRNAPWLNFENTDVVRWGERVTLKGRGFKNGDRLLWVGGEKRQWIEPTVRSDKELEFTVPSGIGPGYFRAVRGKRQGNAVPVNVYPPKDEAKP